MTPSSKTTHELMFEKLADGLDSTTNLTRALLSEIKESEGDFAAIKTELTILRENVKGLSSIVREGNGETSLITKMALIEKEVKDISKWTDNHIDIHQRSKQSISSLKDSFESLEKRLEKLETSFKDYKNKIDSNERKIKEKEDAETKAMRDSIHREHELTHEKNKTEISIKKEKQSFYLKIIAIVILTIVTAGTTWITKNIIDDGPSRNQQQHQK